MSDDPLGMQEPSDYPPEPEFTVPMVAICATFLKTMRDPAQQRDGRMMEFVIAELAKEKETSQNIYKKLNEAGQIMYALERKVDGYAKRERLSATIDEADNGQMANANKMIAEYAELLTSRDREITRAHLKIEVLLQTLLARSGK